MKSFLFTILMYAFFAAVTHARADDCREMNSENGQTHSVCTIEGKDFHFLDIHGSMNDLAYYHGKFLSSYMKKGVLQAVLDRRDESLAAMSKSDRAQFQTVYSCIMGRYERSIGKGLISEFESLAKGTRDGGTYVSDKDVIEASLMIELSGYVDSLMLEMEQNKTKATLELFSRCGLKLSASAAKGALEKLSRPLRNMKMGCTGFVASSEFTQTGADIHGRNFDTGFVGVFEKFPVFLRHTPTFGVTYMGMSTVGLHYAGGISGMNAAGMSISTHELRTTNYRTLYPLKLDLKPLNGKIFKREMALTGPYLANKILKEAKSIDEAVALVKRTGNFGAWSFLITDAKTGEAASIEISGDIVRVAKRTKGSMAQTNHFISPDTKADNFEHSINKSLESRARLALVEESLRNSKGNIDINWGIELLSGHRDYYQGLRSFGRTVSKAYTSMTHVMDVTNKEFWFSIGNSYPTNLSNFAGIKIDFKAKKDFFQLLNTVEGQKDLKASMPNFVSSLHEYTMAYFSYNSAKGETIEGLKGTLGHLEAAKSMSMLDGVLDFPTSIMISRVSIKLYADSGDIKFLNRADQELTAIYTGDFASLHTAERSQVMQDIGIVYFFKGHRELSQKYFKEAQKLLLPLQKQFPDHFYLQKLVSTINNYENNGLTAADVKLNHLDFATVE